MKFKIDENLPEEYAAILREAGYPADTVVDEGLAGSDDKVVFAECQQEVRVLVTLDLDFSNTKQYPPGTHQGIVVVRSKAQDKPTLVRLFRRVVPIFKDRQPAGQLWIVEHDRVRFRS